MERIPAAAIVSALALSCCLSSALRAEDDATFFTKTVQPILTDRCISCHGASKQKGHLRLDSREAVLKGGKNGAAAVSAKPDESLMIKAIRYQDDDLKMPPKGKQLSEVETKALVDWVTRGMPWPDGAKIGDASGTSDKKDQGDKPGASDKTSDTKKDAPVEEKKP